MASVLANDYGKAADALRKVTQPKPEIDPNDPNMALLNEAIQQLTRIEKAIIMLYLEEKSYKEISDIMGISHSNVGVKINRIKIKLEKIIKKEKL